MYTVYVQCTVYSVQCTVHTVENQWGEFLSYISQHVTFQSKCAGCEQINQSLHTLDWHIEVAIGGWYTQIIEIAAIWKVS